MRRVILITLLLLGAKCIWAQDYPHFIRNYTAVDGLPQSQIVTLVEDRNGYLWQGTYGGGISRFDGKEFKAYTTKNGLLSNDITELVFDRHQNLLILHAKGLTKFDGAKFTLFSDSTIKGGKQFRKIYQQKDTIFLISYLGTVAKIYNDSVYYWQKYIIDGKSILRFYESKEGALYYYLEDGSFYVKNRNKTYRFKPEQEVGKIFNIYEYKGSVVIQTYKGAFTVLYKEKRLDKFLFAPENYVIKYDEKEDCFWTSNNTGILRENVTPVKKQELLIRDAEAMCVLHDSEGNIWFGTNGRGLYKYFIRDFNRCSSENMTGIMTIMRDKSGATWLGSLTRGWWRMKNGKAKHYYDEMRNAVHAIKQAPDGTIWLATRNGLGRYIEEKDDYEWFTIKKGLAGNNINAIEFEEDGSMWIGTMQRGLSHYKDGKFTNYQMQDGLATNSVWSIHYSNYYKTLFIGHDLGVQALKNGKFEKVALHDFMDTNIISIHSYLDSLILVGTGGGGFGIVNPVSHATKFITTSDGLASDVVYFVAEDEKHYIWAGTEKGINKLKLDTHLGIHENLYYGCDNGLTGMETNANAFYLTPENKYFGLVDGLYEFNDLGNKDRRSFDLHLTDIQILYGEYSPRQYSDSVMGFYKIPFNPQLPPDKNHLTFFFNRVDKRYPKSVQFKYFMENFDKTWSMPSATTQVTYSNLPPGNYVFRVMSTNNEGSWADAKIAYAFTIKAPFYQTASFIVGMFILLGGLITLILYIRVKQRINHVMMLERIRVKEQETLRKEIARDFHDEMGNQLTRIINYISLLKINSHANATGDERTYQEDNDLYTKVEDSAKYLYSGTRDFIWSIDPGNDELSKLFIHIRDFGEKLFEEKNINFRAFNEVKEKIKLPYGFSREANFIFKEVMTNAFKYSNAENVALTLKRDENVGFEMSFEDDGVGFPTDQIQKSNGLQNIRDRADRIHAVLRISSEYNRGTKIILRFTLTKTLKYGLAL